MCGVIPMDSFADEEFGIDCYISKDINDAITMVDGTVKLNTAD